jgi:hypothetical protein
MTTRACLSTSTLRSFRDGVFALVNSHAAVACQVAAVAVVKTKAKNG